MVVVKEVDSNNVKDKMLNFTYESDGYYDLLSSEDGLTFSFQYQNHPNKIVKSSKDALVPSYIEEPLVFIAYKDDKEVGYLTLGIERWNNRLRIWNILVLNEYQNQGIGTILMKKAKEVMKLTSSRQIVLETQSCNNRAINFYIKNGFRFIGFDTACYSNFDLMRKEIRMEFAYDNIDEELKVFEEKILNEIKSKPLMKEIDILKFIYQSEFGPGHLISDVKNAYEYLLLEIEKMSKTSNENLIDNLTNNVIRINLIPYLNKGYDKKTLITMLAISASLIKGSPYLYKLKIKRFLSLIEKYQLNYDCKLILELLNYQQKNNYQPFSHSDEYKKGYEPHYRVLKKSVFKMFNLTLDDLKSVFKYNVKEMYLFENDELDFAKYQVKLDNNQNILLYISDISNYNKLKDYLKNAKIEVLSNEDLVIGFRNEE